MKEIAEMRRRIHGHHQINRGKFHNHTVYLAVSLQRERERGGGGDTWTPSDK